MQFSSKAKLGVETAITIDKYIMKALSIKKFEAKDGSVAELDSDAYFGESDQRFRSYPITC